MSQIIWTNHLKKRIKERGIDARLVDKAIRFPSEIKKSSSTGSFKYIKHLSDQTIIVALKKEKNNWIILSVWKKSSAKKYHISTQHNLLWFILKKITQFFKRIT